MKTLKFQILFILIFVLCVLTALTVWFIQRTHEDRKLAVEYSVKNELVGYLNAAAGWQAIERGLGATIIGSGEGNSYILFQKFLEMGKKGDSKISQAEEYLKKIVTNKSKDKIFIERINQWRKGYNLLRETRRRIERRAISINEWLAVATTNINNEFNLRNILFIPLQPNEYVLYLNGIIRSNIATFAEFAGLERALISNTIASGTPFSDETMNLIKQYQFLIDQSLGKILFLKGLPSTSDEVEDAIEKFEEEFIRSFHRLVEKVFIASSNWEEMIDDTFRQIKKRRKVFQNNLAGISKDLLNISSNKHVIALAKALTTEENTSLPVLLSEVENLFQSYSQIRKVFVQMRYLDNTGHERVRVDFENNTVKIIRGKQLQDKSHRPYFRRTINLQAGDIYLSPLDLNRENKEIDIPFKPVLRYAVPVVIDKKPAGIVALNLIADTGSFLHMPIKGEKSLEPYILANQDGFYLRHPDSAKEWGMMEGLNRKHHNVKQDYPEVAKQILSGKEGVFSLRSGKTIVYIPFFPHPETDNDNFWVIIKSIRGMEYPIDAVTWFSVATKAIDSGLSISNAVRAEADDHMSREEFAAKRNMIAALFVFFLVIVFSFLILWWLRSRLLKPIHRLMDMTQKVAQEDFCGRVEINTKNELGKLGQSFNKMIEDINKSTKEIKESEKRLKEAERIALTGHWELDLVSNKFYWSDEVYRIFNLNPQDYQATYEAFLERVHPEDRKFVDEEYRGSLKKKVPYDLVHRILMKDGTIKYVNEKCNTFYDDEGNPLRSLGTVQDITDRVKKEEIIKSQQQQLVHADRLASLGTIASGVAHEINNPVTFLMVSTDILKIFWDKHINGVVEKALREESGDVKKLRNIHDEMPKLLHSFEKGVHRIIKIVDNLKDFSRRKESTFQPENICECIEEALKFSQMNATLRYRTRIDCHFADSIPDITIDKQEIEQVFVNLFLNAAHAMEGMEDARLSVLTRQTPENVVVTVTDNGKGMDSDTSNKIFSPFFSTKFEEGGTGLGLSICHDIIKRHGGNITVQSISGEGTTFTITLPKKNIATQTD